MGSWASEAEVQEGVQAERGKDYRMTLESEGDGTADADQGHSR